MDYPNFDMDHPNLQPINCRSFFADVMKANPDLYKKLKDKKTKLGCTLGHCIKTGIDNPGKHFRYCMFPFLACNLKCKDIP